MTFPVGKIWGFSLEFKTGPIPPVFAWNPYKAWSGASPRAWERTLAKLRLVMAAMGQPETVVGDFCRELGITRQTLYRHVGPDGSLRSDGLKIMGDTIPTISVG